MTTAQTTRLRPSDVPVELRQRLANGCGGSGSIFRLPPVLADPEACAWHDVAYAIGGSAWQRFLDDCWMLVYWIKRAFKRNTDAEHEGYKLWGRIGIAVASFFAVRVWGWKYFNYGEPRTLSELEALARSG